jgi:putative hydrolase of the HAD superfamily
MKATWLFFDMGSTIMNETPAMEKRIRDSIAGTDITFEAFAAKMAEFRAMGMREDLATFDYFEIHQRTPWPRDAEIPYPEAEAVLRTLKERGYRLGIIASQPLGSEQRLARFGLRDFFDVICASAEEGLDKPDPALYRRALTRAECAPEDAVMIGDRTDNDVAPAKSLGMQTVLIRQGYGGHDVIHHDGEIPDVTVDGLLELLDIFE